MEIWHAIFLGALEGFTEFLPISSTGHLIIFSTIFEIPHSSFLKTFTIGIQSGAILAVILLYFKSLLDIRVIKRIACAFIPTALIGYLLYDLVRNVLLESVLVVLFALFFGGIAIILFEYWYAKQKTTEAKRGVTLETIPLKDAFFIGVAQALALIPGVSRSAASIIGGLLQGLPRNTTASFSFLLAVPTLLAATALDFMHTGFSLGTEEWLLLTLGAFVSFCTAIIAIRFLVSYVSTHSFVVFGVYRIIAALLFAAIIYL